MIPKTDPQVRASGCPDGRRRNELLAQASRLVYPQVCFSTRMPNAKLFACTVASQLALGIYNIPALAPPRLVRKVHTTDEARTFISQECCTGTAQSHHFSPGPCLAYCSCFGSHFSSPKIHLRASANNPLRCYEHRLQYSAVTLMFVQKAPHMASLCPYSEK